jgi:hypothetical protein
MGLKPDIIELEIVLKIAIRKAPNISSWKALTRYVNFTASSDNRNVIRVMRDPVFLGQNFGYLQLSPPIPKPIKNIRKKIKKIKPKKRL